VLKSLFLQQNFSGLTGFFGVYIFIFLCSHRSLISPLQGRAQNVRNKCSTEPEEHADAEGIRTCVGGVQPFACKIL